MIHVLRIGPALEKPHAWGLRPVSRIIGNPKCRAPRSNLAVNPTEVRRLIEQGLAATEISVESEDNTHFQALVVSAEFAGKRPLLRHQLVYATLGARMGREIHALSLRTLTPEEWRRERGAAPADSSKG